jgi:hypothetical protein
LLAELRAETAAIEKLAQGLMPAAPAGWRRGQARSPDRQARGAPARRREAKLIAIGPRAEQALADAESR